MVELQLVVLAKNAEAAHELLRQRGKRTCNMVAYPANEEDPFLLYYIACSTQEVQDQLFEKLCNCHTCDAATRENLNAYAFQTISPNILGDPVILVRLRPTEIAKKLGVHVHIH